VCFLESGCHSDLADQHINEQPDVEQHNGGRNKGETNYMGWVIFAGLCFLIGIVFLIVSRKFASGSEDRLGTTAVGAVGVIAALAIMLISSFTTVGANRVGVVTEFGRYVGIIQSGPHLLWPWKSVEELPTRIQPLELPDVPVRFEGNSGGTADLLTEWRVEGSDERSIKRLWSDYRTLDAVQDRVVQANSRNALNVVLAEYTPSEGVSGNSLTKITQATLTEIQNRLKGTGVVVERITIRQIDPDPVSQDRINRQVQAQADLERTEVTKQIATQEAAIAATRQQSQTPQSLQYECLRIIADWDAQRQGPMPQTFNCNFGAPGDPVILGR
jgi:regulator of protease activity HflC (stomatin/prohibitin superfamily)